MGEREEPEGGVDSSCGPGVVGVATRRLEPRRESPGDLRFSRLGEVFCRNSLVHIHSTHTSNVCITGIPGAKNRGRIELYVVVFAKVTLVRLSNSLGLTKISKTNYYKREENASNTFPFPADADLTKILHSYITLT